MKLKELSTSQFAGLREQNIAFTDGINMIYGKNESGKSTLVNLLSRTLFQNARYDGRKDKEFRELYFPGDYRSRAAVADFIDGTVTFETEDGTYTLSKEWGNEAKCILKTANGMIKEQKKIDELLREKLLYGEGVYSDMLFSSQRNTDSSLKDIMNAKERTDAKQEIVSAVSRAFAESDGISIDEMEDAIDKKIKDIAGKHWDFERNCPEGKAGRWSKELGKVLPAYYALKDAEAELAKISELEEAADKQAVFYTKLDKIARSAEEEFHKFSSFAGKLEALSEKKKAAGRLEADAKKLEEALDEWPKLVENLEKAAKLKLEKTNRDCLEQYDAARKVKEELDTLDQSLLCAKCPAREEIRKVRNAQNEITGLKNKLSAMNLSASLNMFGGNTVEIKSLSSGRLMEASEKFAITEAVQITVPGVMELRLAPANADVTEIEMQIAEKKEVISTVFENYQVDTPEALEELAQKISDEKSRYESAEKRLSEICGAFLFEELERTVKEITVQVRDREIIMSEIRSLCNSDDVGTYITRTETKIVGYSEMYGDMESLRTKICDNNAELQEAKDAIESVRDIPEEYRGVADPDSQLKKLKSTWDTAQKAKEDALQKKAATVKELESYYSNIDGDPAANVENASRELEEQKMLLARWLHIKQVFDEEKAKLSGNPMKDIAESFTCYLGIISDGKVSSEFPEADKLNMNVYSDDRLVNYGKLSEGTKETVSLAFRLAVLDHLFPEGGGVIVLDDPLTDMDYDRVKQACALIKECAKRHQVIFLTCREEYLSLLGGNVIRLP